MDMLHLLCHITAALMLAESAALLPAAKQDSVCCQNTVQQRCAAAVWSSSLQGLTKLSDQIL